MHFIAETTYAEKLGPGGLIDPVPGLKNVKHRRGGENLTGEFNSPSPSTRTLFKTFRRTNLILSSLMSVDYSLLCINQSINQSINHLFVSNASCSSAIPVRRLAVKVLHCLLYPISHNAVASVLRRTDKH